MRELEKIFDRWYTCEAADFPETRQLFNAVMELLCKNCTEEVCDRLFDDLLLLMEQGSRQAFLAGYQAGFSIFFEFAAHALDFKTT